MKKVLLHICCGVCGWGSIEGLKKEGFFVEAFFFNPNIYPYAEYLRRLKAAKKVAKELKINIYTGEYLAAKWFGFSEFYSQEKEGGRRCQLCYESRLRETFNLCCKKEFDYFATTLSISPHKDTAVINEVGKNISLDKFLALDFKKNDGFRKTINAAKKLNLYRQKYCGCIYSQK